MQRALCGQVHQDESEGEPAVTRTHEDTSRCNSVSQLTLRYRIPEPSITKLLVHWEIINDMLESGHSGIRTWPRNQDSAREINFVLNFSVGDTFVVHAY